MVSSLLTLYGGIIFSQKEHSLSALSVTFFTMIIISNCRFLILWVFCMTTVFKKRRFAEVIGKWIKKTFCLDVPFVNRFNINLYYRKMKSTYATAQNLLQLTTHKT